MLDFGLLICINNTAISIRELWIL